MEDVLSVHAALRALVMERINLQELLALLQTENQERVTEMESVSPNLNPLHASIIPSSVATAIVSHRISVKDLELVGIV